MRVLYGFLIFIVLCTLYWLPFNPMQPQPKPLCLNHGYSFLNTQLQIKIKQEPKNPKHYLQRAQLYLNQGDTALALKDLNTAVQFNSANAAAYFLRAKVYSALLKSSEALTNINAAIFYDSLNADYYHFRGIVKRDNADYIGAMNDYQKAIRLGKINLYVASGC